jgi:hypothetical protein
MDFHKKYFAGNGGDARSTALKSYGTGATTTEKRDE